MKMRDEMSPEMNRTEMKKTEMKRTRTRPTCDWTAPKIVPRRVFNGEEDMMR